MPFKNERPPWGRWIVEFILILASVYLAVFLESAYQARADQGAARSALGQLLGELREDRDDFRRIIEIQDGLDGHYTNLGRWLADPASYPADSVGAALHEIATENSTLFARRASWTTMVSAGQLADLDAPELVLRLGQLYETVYARIDYNSRFYDEELNEELRATSVIRWNSLATAPLTRDPQEIERFMFRIERVHMSWNVWYRDLLIQYENDVIDAIAAVEEYLEAVGA